MDVLSDIFHSVRVNGSALVETRCGGDWGIDMVPSTSGIPFHYITKGECWLLSEDGPVPLHEGDLVVAMHWPPHALAANIKSKLMTAEELVSSNNSEFWKGGTLQRPNTLTAGTGRKTVTILSGLLALEGRGSAALIDQLPSLLHLRAKDDSLGLQLRMALQFIQHESKNLTPGYMAVADQMTKLLFIQILRSALSQPTVPIGLLAGLVDPHIKQALAAIHAHPSNRWTVANLAKSCGLCRTVFAEQFKSLIGITPIHYVTRWRMTLAEEMLMQSDLSIEGVRQKLGFSSGFSFTRTFRAHSGLSPREYRRSGPGKE
ncbi:MULTISPECIES: AraC family transcriptional regulator [Sphingobium]|uniref:AraC family transcriptional regulator n=1 Tax=Sphingobium TaxID=165695 RepID=UPI00159CB6A0|nr:AraC family transcriptional regulator [Sphingobium sp. 15-1]